MPRRIQDIVPSDRRSIRNIPVDKSARSTPETKKSQKEASAKERVYEIEMHKIQEDETVEIPEEKKPAPRKEKKNRNKRQWNWLFLGLGIFVIVAGIGFVASSHYSHATFTIVPKVIPVTVNGTYVTQATPGTSIMYELASFKGSAATSIPATSGAAVSIKAQGKVTLYNSYSAQAVKLIAGSRFSDSTGRVYRLNSSVSVPGYTSKSGGVIPGSIAGIITADSAGESYNVSSTDPLSDFKIIAYKGTPKYDSIYGRLVSSIAGGFIGVKKVVNQTLVASTTAILQDRIKVGLVQKALSMVPEGYIMYPDSYAASFTQSTIDGTDPKTAVLTIQGTVYAILFKKTDLTSHLAGASTTASFGTFSYTMPGLDSLHFNIVNAKDFSPEKKNSLIVRLQGDMKLVGSIPVDAIKKKLAGVALSETESILKPYNQVIGSGSSGELTPPWAKVPLDTSRITVIVQE